MVEIRAYREFYFIRDLETEIIYLRNRKFIQCSESSKNMEHKLQQMEVINDPNIKHILENRIVKKETASPVVRCMRKAILLYPPW